MVNFDLYANGNWNQYGVLRIHVTTCALSLYCGVVGKTPYLILVLFADITEEWSVLSAVMCLWKRHQTSAVGVAVSWHLSQMRQQQVGVWVFIDLTICDSVVWFVWLLLHLFLTIIYLLTLNAYLCIFFYSYIFYFSVKFN